ncbi:MAG TPA: dihydroorotate dehydrogenase [Solirubrobacterales bacterium]|jgi:dihydroorotate dehydrogenase (NAD+) catalytic subunit|nr:dihydroorotate dehydrogenase [Solirubrobacterales bacterium]
MAIDFCGIELAHPVVNGSGTYDAIAAHRIFGPALDDDFPFAAYVSKTITLEPRAGNPPPRLWELGQGMINSIGLPNKGLERFVSEDLPQYASLPVPLIVSVMGFTADELATILERLDDHAEIAFLELNFSCPNVKTGNIVGSDPIETEAMMTRLRPLTDKPLVAKLAPSTSRPDLVAKAAEAAGADGLSLINTLPGMALAPGTDRPWLGGETGGISGPAIRPVALAQVARVSKAVSIPVIGMGGVENGRHAADLISAGARLVAVGTENFRDPAAGTRVANELAALNDRSLTSA